MKNREFKYFSIMIALIVSILALSASGAFAISMKTRHKAEISNRIRLMEREISDLKRETEDLNVRIAEQENPIILGRRAGNTMGQPQVSGIIWVYEDSAADRIIFSESNKSTVSFKISQNAGSSAAR